MVYAAILATMMTAQAPDVTYDKFDDRTRIRLQLDAFEIEDDTWNISMSTSYAGKEPYHFNDSHLVQMVITKTGDDWKLLKYHDLKMMVGDDRIPHSVDQFRASEKKYCSEQVITKIRLGDMKEFLEKGADWEIKIGIQKPFSIGEKDRARMKQFVEVLQKGRLSPHNQHNRQHPYNHQCAQGDPRVTLPRLYRRGPIEAISARDSRDSSGDTIRNSVAIVL